MIKKRALAASRWQHIEDTMKYKLKKTDGRFTGHTVYEYFIDCTMSFAAMQASGTWGTVNRMLAERKKLNELRNWCWETFGPACELETALLLDRDGESPEWCWRSEHNQLRIYFKKKTAEWYTLKWT